MNTGKVSAAGGYRWRIFEIEGGLIFLWLTQRPSVLIPKHDSVAVGDVLQSKRLTSSGGGCRYVLPCECASDSVTVGRCHTCTPCRQAGVNQPTYCTDRRGRKVPGYSELRCAHEYRQASRPIKSRYPLSRILPSRDRGPPTGSAWLKAARVLEVNTGASSGGGSVMLEFNTPGL